MKPSLKRLTQLSCLGALLTTTGAYANTQPTPQLPNGAQLIKQTDQGSYAYRLNDMIIIKITGNSFSNMGSEYGTLLKSQLHTQLQAEEKSTGFLADGIVDGNILKSFINNHDLTEHETEFLQGEAKASDMTFNDALFMNLSFLFSINEPNKKLVSHRFVRLLQKKPTKVSSLAVIWTG